MGTGSGLAFDVDAVAARIGTLGTTVSPAVLEASKAVYEPFHERAPYQGVHLTRDVSYGAHERQRLDVFAPAATTGDRPLPVLVFFHGGGFVGGDKHRPGTPYNDNVALWAVRHGMVGVNATYRLAPESTWPSGAEDVAAVLTWTRANLATHGGDPDRVYLMGTSAGAVHVASYLAHRQFHLPGGVGAAGGILLSGAYDLTTFDPALLRPYLGEDRGRYAEHSPLPGLVEAAVPVLYGVAEFDSAAAERQALQVVSSYYERHGRWPRLVRLMGHNHFTATLHLGTPDEYLGDQIVRLVEGSRSSASKAS